MPELFHFLHPLWFLALLPLALLLWWLPRADLADSDWKQAVEGHLLPHLLNQPEQVFKQLPIWLLAAGGLLAILALADPSWQKKPQPVYRTQDAEVIVLDLSRSMMSGDLPPSRLERARLKVAEILKRRKEGQTGLVVFAGDAFTVSPLTTDARTIKALLKPLNPDLMPVQGSRADLGIEQAGKLLKQAGVNRGNILLISDGYSDQRALDIATDMRRQGFRLSVLGVGSDKQAPIPDPQGGFVRDSQGKVVMPTLDIAKLQDLASAGAGRYSTITVNDADLARILPKPLQTMNSPMQGTDQTSDMWQSQGPWLLLALLPLAAFAFRRGWLLALPLVITVTLSSVPQSALASGWDDLWQRPDQQAAKALQSGDAARAQQLAESPLLRGEAAYRSGNYTAALNAFSASDTAQGSYNRGNALAQLGRYQDAIKAYDAALSKNPSLADASHNKQEIEKLLKKQKQKQKQQQAENKDNKKDGSKGKEKDQQQANKQNGSNGKEKDQQQANKQNGSKGKEKDQQQANKQNGSNGKEKNQQQANKQNGSKGKEKNQQQANKQNGSNGKEKNQQQANKQNGSKGKEKNQQQARAERQTDSARSNPDTTAASAPVNPADSEQQQADALWLNRIPDDPGGLLRRKFLYQYSQRGTQQSTAQQSW